MAKPSQELINGRLRDALHSRGCPVCYARASEINTPADGIPEELAFEVVFGCGSRIGVHAGGGDYLTTTGCPDGGLQELRTWHEEIIDALEDEFPEDDARIERLVDELERVNAETESATATLSRRLEALRAREATDV